MDHTKENMMRLSTNPEHGHDEHGMTSKSSSRLERKATQRSKSAEGRKSFRKKDKNSQIYTSAICLFGILNILLVVLNGLAVFYLVSEKAPPQPTSRLCVRCQQHGENEDVNLHPQPRELEDVALPQQPEEPEDVDLPQHSEEPEDADSQETIDGIR
ncbi:hypothetical protein MAR_022634 [Mya arenaria]|uniref:Uncharacterized protein n=1 Tax=Mya arenaria TaxID=6604 RepID=A0ABY7DMT8_MYAAR|nr:hypothetical protein MAR_022634 [Mya arenaria]